MEPKRRTEVIGLMVLSMFEKKGLDLRKYRRDVGTEAKACGIERSKFAELMSVASCYAMNGATQQKRIDPWQMTHLSKEEIYAIAEQAFDNVIFSGRKDYIGEFGRILQKQSASESEARDARLTEFFQNAAALGITPDEVFEIFEDTFRRLSETIIAKVKETVTVITGQASVI